MYTSWQKKSAEKGSRRNPARTATKSSQQKKKSQLVQVQTEGKKRLLREREGKGHEPNLQLQRKEKAIFQFKEQTCAEKIYNRNMEGSASSIECFFRKREEKESIAPTIGRKIYEKKEQHRLHGRKGRKRLREGGPPQDEYFLPDTKEEGFHFLGLLTMAR